MTPSPPPPRTSPFPGATTGIFGRVRGAAVVLEEPLTDATPSSTSITLLTFLSGACGRYGVGA